jgi:integrase
VVPRVVGSNPIIHPLRDKRLIQRTNSESAFFCAKLAPNPSIDYGLVSNDNNINAFPFKPAKLNSCNNDLSKRWYIEFSAWCVEIGKLRRKRLYQINNEKTVSKRHQFAETQIRQINNLLSSGFHFDDVKKNRDRKNELVCEGLLRETAIDALTEMHNNIVGAYRVTTKNSYMSKLRSFVNFIKNENEKLGIEELEPKHLRGFVGYLTGVEEIGNRTTNSKVQYIRSLLDKLVEDNVLKVNPFEKYKPLPEKQSTLHEVFDDGQIEKMKDYMFENDEHLWNFVQFIFFTYIRPTELRKLKVKHIFLSERKIFVPADISKNKKDGYVYIPDRIAEIIKENKIHKADRNSFIFCKSGYGGFDHLTKHDMYRKHKKMLELMEMEGEYTLYSWKHTGVTKAYKNGIDIKALQRQCRHSSIDITDNYLRALGLGENEGFANKINEVEI